MPKQSHGLAVIVGSLKPSGDRARSVFTPPSTLPAPRNQINHTPAPGKTPLSPDLPAEQLEPRMPTRLVSKPRSLRSDNRKPGAASRYASGAERPSNPPRRGTRRPS